MEGVEGGEDVLGFVNEGALAFLGLLGETGAGGLEVGLKIVCLFLEANFDRIFFWEVMRAFRLK